MYKIILADDNPLIRMGMKSMIKWNELKAELVGEAEDGDEALELIRTGRADLLITDIRMPGKDGLYLIREINENYPDMSTIIISAYNEFSYAKEALKAGSVDYILKPIDPEEMNTAIRKAMERKKEREAESYGMEMAALPSLIVLRTQKPYSMDEMRLLLRKYPDVHITEEKNLSILSFDGSEYSADRLEDVLKKEIPEGILSGKAAAKENETREEILTAAKEDACRNFLKEAGDRIIDKKPQRQPDTGSMVILCKSGNSEKAKALYHQNQEWILQQSNGNTDLWEKNTERFAGLLLSLDTEGNCGAQEILRKVGGQRKELFYGSQEELDLEMERCIERLCSSLSGRKGSRSEIVRAVQEYIERCYGEELSLSGIAESFHISAPYLSKIFKEESGQNLNQFITEVRVKKAQYILENSDRKISEIAELVGYDDVNYFIKVYKKVTGKTPAQDRKL